MALLESVWVAHWIDMKMLGPINDWTYMGGVLAFLLLACTMIIVVTYASMRVSVISSRVIHSKVVGHILRAPIDSFFDKQPVGRLVNRLSYDMRIVDSAIVMVINQI